MIESGCGTGQIIPDVAAMARTSSQVRQSARSLFSTLFPAGHASLSVLP